MNDVDLTGTLTRRGVLRGIGAISGIGMLAAVAPPAAFAGGHGHRHNQAIIERYWETLNAGMASTTGDFSAMAEVYANDATLTQSNPAGVTTINQGIDAIIAFYGRAYVKFRGYQWTLDTTRWLTHHIALNYEHAGSPPLTVPGRCAHLFTLRHGRIQTLDWVTYFGGTV